MPTYDVLITGCSSGIGMRTACRLAQQGHRVYATLRDLATQDRLLQEAEKRQTSVTTLQLDVTDDASVQAAMAEVKQSAGKLDVLVNNAGYGLGGAFEDLLEDEIRAIMETNFFGVQRVIRHGLPLIRQSQAGKIINVSSVAGLIGVPVLGAYSTSKYAVEGFSESLRYELLRSGIYVVLVEPGCFQTKIWLTNRRLGQQIDDSDSYYQGYTEKLIDVSVKNYDIMSDPEDVAKLIERIIRMKKPSLRYRVGWDCNAVTAMKSLLPFDVYSQILEATLLTDPASLRKVNTSIPEDLDYGGSSAESSPAGSQ